MNGKRIPILSALSGLFQKEKQAPRSRKIPTASMLLVFSYLIAVLGFASAVALVVAGFGEVRFFITGILVLVGALSLAVALRMFANIGQVLFEVNLFLFNDLKPLLSGMAQHIKNIEQDSKAGLQTLNQNIHSFREDLHDRLQDLEPLRIRLEQDLETLKDHLEKIGCDSKDVNQDIHQIKAFFGQIREHLDLKK